MNISLLPVWKILPIPMISGVPHQTASCALKGSPALPIDNWHLSCKTKLQILRRLPHQTANNITQASSRHESNSSCARCIFSVPSIFVSPQVIRREYWRPVTGARRLCAQAGVGGLRLFLEAHFPSSRHCLNFAYLFSAANS